MVKQIRNMKNYFYRKDHGQEKPLGLHKDISAANEAAKAVVNKDFNQLIVRAEGCGYTARIVNNNVLCISSS